MNAQTVSAAAGMAADQRQREDDHKLWVQDVHAWQEDQRRALAQLQRLTNLVQEHGRCLDDHMESVQEHARLATSDGQTSSGVGVESDLPDWPSHPICPTRQHENQSWEHRSLEKQHRILMAHLAMMTAAIEAAA